MSVRWNDLHVEDLEYIANVLKHFKEADTFNGEDDTDRYRAYIAAETPSTPIYRPSGHQRVLLGHVVKGDYGVWSFEPSAPDVEPE